jgi:hypothetical protein
VPEKAAAAPYSAVKDEKWGHIFKRAMNSKLIRLLS